MTALTRYRIRALRQERGWELRVEGVGVTHSRTLAGAETMVREYLRVGCGPDAADAAVITLSVEIYGTDSAVDDEIDHFRTAVQELRHRQEDVLSRSRGLAQSLRGAGLSGADAAVVMGLSAQRYSQIIRAAERNHRRTRRLASED